MTDGDLDMDVDTTSVGNPAVENGVRVVLLTATEERDEGVFSTEEANQLSGDLWRQRQHRLSILLDLVLTQTPEDAATIEALNWAGRTCSHMRGLSWVPRFTREGEQ